MKNGSATFPPFLGLNPDLRLLMFGGKGGVGKTTCAVATALQIARNDPSVSYLLASTDPAHSLSDSLAGFPLPPNLKVLELDAQEYLRAFKEKHGPKLKEIASRGTFLDEDDIAQFLELSLPGMDELMSFLEITRWVKERSYDCIILDTAPTGHTLKLLEMPRLIRKWLEALDALLAKHRYMKKLFSGRYQRDQNDLFLDELSSSLQQMELLMREPRLCRFVPVMLAEVLSVRETLALLGELEILKVPVTDLVVNRLYPDLACPTCQAERIHQQRELAKIFHNASLSRYSFWGLPLYPEEVRKERLQGFWSHVVVLPDPRPVLHQAPMELNFQVEAAGYPFPPDAALLLLAGKGGVGKTTLACATALRLAHDLPGKEVLLFSTDPAHSLSDCLEMEIGAQPTRVSSGLTAVEIDAQAEFDALKTQYQEELGNFLQSVLPNLDLEFDREVMERILDLSPPGLDEIMALTRVMDFLTQGNYDLLILDSAPTGHFIRLLELPELIEQWLKVFFGLFLKYKKIFRLPKISQRLVKMSKQLKLFRALLTNPTRSALYAVSILTEMAFQETLDLAAAGERIGVSVPMLFLNLATPASACPLCAALHRRESQMEAKFQQAFPGIRQTLVYRQGEPRGLPRLQKLGQAMYLHRESQSVMPAEYALRKAC